MAGHRPVAHTGAADAIRANSGTVRGPNAGTRSGQPGAGGSGRGADQATAHARAAGKIRTAPGPADASLLVSEALDAAVEVMWYSRPRLFSAGRRKISKRSDLRSNTVGGGC